MIRAYTAQWTQAAVCLSHRGRLSFDCSTSTRMYSKELRAAVCKRFSRMAYIPGTWYSNTQVLVVRVSTITKAKNAYLAERFSSTFRKIIHV